MQVWNMKTGDGLLSQTSLPPPPPTSTLTLVVVSAPLLSQELGVHSLRKGDKLELALIP